jgi:hypothetical protein
LAHRPAGPRTTPNGIVGNERGATARWLGTLHAQRGGPFYTAGAPVSDLVALLFNEASTGDTSEYGIDVRRIASEAPCPAAWRFSPSASPAWPPDAASGPYAGTT